jgi:hypothetical protein
MLYEKRKTKGGLHTSQYDTYEIMWKSSSYILTNNNRQAMKAVHLLQKEK